MATLLQTLPQGKITREEVNRLLESGYFDGQRFELIDGELINKMGQGPRHANAIQLLLEMLVEVFGVRRTLVQAPIEAGPRDQRWSQPEPDISVIAAARRPADRHPNGAELLLAIEVADSSLRQDSVRKRDMYAHAGVPEYWVLDIDGRQLLVFRNLENETYTEQLTLSETDLAPHIEKPIAELL
ncbi:MAG: Uma2 family endonuclease [Acidobacteriota bacterium]